VSAGFSKPPLCLINGVTGQVESSTQVTGKPTDQALKRCALSEAAAGNDTLV
jgi:hypothetical protein